MTFKNFDASVFVVSSGYMFLNNVNFTDCYSQDTVLLDILYGSGVSLNNCAFSSLNVSSVFQATESNLTVNNASFSDVNCNSSVISQSRGVLKVDNTVFDGFSAKHGGAINFKGNTFSIRNSTFVNSYANLTGGAIIAKYFALSNDNATIFYPSDEMTIENCVFANLSSQSNGGGICLDLDSGSHKTPQTLNVVNSNFSNCSSRYGGAIGIIGGNLNIVDSSFIDNDASFDGGAIYSSWTNITVNRTSFISNAAAKNAGALFADNARLTIQNSNFTDNELSDAFDVSANAIYARDINLNLSDSFFDNGGVSVYADFAEDCSLENIEKNDDVFLLNNTNYITFIETEGITFNLTNNTILVDELPSKFDARDWGWTSSPKVQGDNDDCWAFATAASMETSLLKATGQLHNLSQNYIQKLQLKYSPVGDKRISLTGFAYSGLGYALSWYGPLPIDGAYDDRGMLADNDLSIPRIHLQDAKFIFPDGNNTQELLKRAILENGAVTVQIILEPYGGEVEDEGDDIAVMYHSIHFISLIGWDDNYTCPDLPNAANGTRGGWITKDSLTGFGIYGYDPEMEKILAVDRFAIVPQSVAISYVFENDIDYHVNYQTDLTSLTGFDRNYSYYSNEFTSQYDEYIGAVGTYFNESGIDYSFDVFVNGEKVHSQNGTSEFAGFRTIVLSKYLAIKTNDTFKVVFKNNNLPYQAYSRVHYMEGKSLASADGLNWTDFAPLNKTVCLKVYTVKEDKEKTSDLIATIIDYKDMNTTAVAKADGRIGKYFAVTLKDENGTVLANKDILIGFNGRVYNKTTDENGSAKLQINLGYKGTYTFAIGFIGDDEYLGAFEVAKITVKVQTPKLASANKSYKATAKTKLLTATFKTANGKLASGKMITFTVNGKTYSAKTNSKGVATVKVSLNKKGTYSFTVKSAGDSTFAAVSKKYKLTLK